MEQYPEDEANSKKTKKTNIGKGKKATPSKKMSNDLRLPAPNERAAKD
jgi:hypothetical protein